MGINQVAGISGMFIGLILGGVLAAVDWRLVFIVSVPIGIGGTIWSYLSLREIGIRTPARIDWLGNVTVRARPDRAPGRASPTACCPTAATRWAGPARWCCPASSAAWPCWSCSASSNCRSRRRCSTCALMRIRAFAAGITATLLASIARGGLQFMLIIWLQGIWLPLHGYDFKDTPLWAGIYLLALTCGFVFSGPVSGWLSDKHGARSFASGGLLVSRRGVRRAAAHPHRLQLPGVRGADLPGGRGHGAVLRAERGRDHEQRPGPAARRRRRACWPPSRTPASCCRSASSSR